MGKSTINLVGGLNLALWKMTEWKSVGMMIIPNMMGKIIQMFQTTNQPVALFDYQRRIIYPRKKVIEPALEQPRKLTRGPGVFVEFQRLKCHSWTLQPWTTTKLERDRAPFGTEEFLVTGSQTGGVSTRQSDWIEPEFHGIHIKNYLHISSYIYYIVQEHLQNDSRRSFAKKKYSIPIIYPLSGFTLTNISWEPPQLAWQGRP